jgi:2-polyprenyl-3-methyl-5-hydroxy-6-metoxy-1,4-benzoquinol methylase
MDRVADIHDRVMEAYYGKLGESLMRSTQARLHWISRHISGDSVLDVGCSQGTLPMLLAREGKSVLALDISTKAIEEAKGYLGSEEPYVQERVEFVTKDFLSASFDKKFDTIVMAEVLEHLVNPENFVKKAQELLQEDGKLIVTVPFGINDFIDHKHTYYFYDLYKMLSNHLNVESYEIVGKWIAFVAVNSKKNENENFISEKLFQDIEREFHSIERELEDELKKVRTNLQNANVKYKASVESLNLITKKQNKLEESYNKLSQESDEKEDRYEEEIDKLIQENIKLEMKVDQAYNTLSFKLGYILLHAFKSPANFINLPKDLLSLSKERKSKKKK